MTPPAKGPPKADAAGMSEFWKLLCEHGEQIAESRGEVNGMSKDLIRLDGHVSDLTAKINGLSTTILNLPTRIRVAIDNCLAEDRKTCRRHVMFGVLAWLFMGAIATAGVVLALEDLLR